MPKDPAEHLAFAKEYGARSRRRIADLGFTAENNIIPARFED
ncbi:hypothetical protein [Streptomyces sp. NPDC007172]